MTKHKRAEELLDRYLRNISAPEEKNLVEQWYNNIDLGSETQRTDWAEASKELFLRQHNRRNHKQHPFAAVKWAAAAAVLILMTGAGFLFFGNSGPQYKNTSITYSAITGPSALKQIQLPDSTIVWLNANSKLEWNSDYSLGKRTVILKGEASFDVHHDAGHPFIVHTADADIRVLGTCFNVETGAGNANTQVALLRGKVAVKLNSDQSSGLDLQPGEVASCSASGKILKKHKTDVAPYFSWIKGGFNAQDMPLQSVVEKLCYRYGYSVNWNNHRGVHKHISVSFQQQDFKSMLESLCYLNHLHYTIHNRTVIIQ